MTPEQFINLMNDPKFVLLFTAIAIWALVWKGIALWKASKEGRKIWFIILLATNTLGILEIIYIYLIGEKHHLGKKEENLSNS